MSRRSALRLLYVGYFLGLIAIFTLVNSGKTGILRIVEYVPFRDKTVHFLLIGGAGLVANLALGLRKWKAGRVMFYTGTCIVFVLATMEECSQMWIPTRTFSWADMSANWLGILFFDGCLRLAESKGWLRASGSVTNKGVVS
jgi:hypothetical protein